MTEFLARYGRVLRENWWLLLLGVLIPMMVSYGLLSRRPLLYQARATLMVGTSLQTLNPDPWQMNLSMTLAGAYAELAKQGPVLEAVIDRLGLPRTPDQLAQQIETRIYSGAQLLEIRVVDTDPEVAALIANALADELIRRSPASGTSDPEQQAFIRRQMADLQARIESVDGEIARLTDRMATLTSAAEIREVQDRIAALETVKTTYQARYADFLQLYNPESPNLLSLFDPASPPQRPIPSRTMLVVAVAGIAGLALAIGALILIDYLDTSLRWENDTVQASLGLPILGAIPHIAHQERTFPKDGQIGSPLLSESIHGIQTTIFFSRPDRAPRTLLITSPGAQEGKSFVLAHLAVALTAAGYRVIAMDADLRRPSLHEFFDKPNVVGLADLLNGQRVDRLSTEVLQKTGIENLWLLPAGRTSIEPALLIGSRRFRALLEELQRYADVILIDSPPVLGPPEAALLASMADATLLVVDDGITRHTAARKARDRLMGQEEVRLLGVVFNRVRSSSYGYLYAYGYSSRNGKPRHRRKKRPYLTVAEAADRLGVSKKTAYHWCRTGKLPAKRIGLWWRVRPEDVDRLIAEAMSKRADMEHAERTPL
ncbi:MAG: polysaccharide biosynthesis tyrosine autokinase [Anaerolineae bacterium]|nr:polysaccharide biosynthesis tyrosine autokinase [Anaerolineae bacterium]